MNTDATGAVLAAVLDALTLVQGQLDTVVRGNARIEASQKDILTRLDTIDAGQAAVTDLVPVLEMILARSIEDRELTRAQLSTVAAIAGFAHAAASGNPAPLPVDVADDPLLERFAFAQPADDRSNERALVEWRKAAANAGTNALLALLARQYQPSPTDTPDTRVLRYRLAAISRAEIEGRGATAPPPPASTVSRDRSAYAADGRSAELAGLWRAGESTALFADPELAGSLDLFARAERSGEGSSDDQLATELAELHRALGDRLAAGERPSAEEGRAQINGDRVVEFRPTGIGR
jgi:hypothetical protein